MKKRLFIPLAIALVILLAYNLVLPTLRKRPNASIC